MQQHGRLEVLLVNAQGIKHRLSIGKPAYYVLIQCGDQIRRSKTTTGHRHEAFWNEKFEFKLPLSEWKKLASLKMSIMDEEYLKNEGFVGQSMIELGGLISEGVKNGSVDVRSRPYNVVLKDDTFKGQIKVGLKFILTKQENGEKMGDEKGREVEEKTEKSIYGSLLRFLNVRSWWKWRFHLLHARD